MQGEEFIVPAALGSAAIRRGIQEMAVNSTYMAKKEQVERKWFIVDATDKVLGRLAAQI